jgi:hypothetical protein
VRAVAAAMAPVVAAACVPRLPPDSDKGDDSDPEESDPPAETDVADDAPCAVPEVEPNDGFPAAQTLPLEREACGVFQTENDADFWTFDLPEEGWLAVDVTAFGRGSEARVDLALVTPAGTLGAFEFGGRPDVHLVYPAGAGRFDAVVRQLVGEDVPRGAGEDYFYALRASQVKPPLDWDVFEAANDAQAAPQTLSLAARPEGAGVAVFGALEDAADEDWYAIPLPAGPSEVRLAALSHSHGALTDLAWRASVGGVLVATRAAGELGVERDPAGTFVVDGPATLVVRVLDELSQSGPASWYVLEARVSPPSEAAAP